MFGLLYLQGKICHAAKYKHAYLQYRTMLLLKLLHLYGGKTGLIQQTCITKSGLGDTLPLYCLL